MQTCPHIARSSDGHGHGSGPTVGAPRSDLSVLHRVHVRLHVWHTEHDPCPDTRPSVLKFDQQKVGGWWSKMEVQLILPVPFIEFNSLWWFKSIQLARCASPMEWAPCPKMLLTARSRTFLRHGRRLRGSQTNVDSEVMHLPP